jgi:hypothetical protein
VITNGDKMEQYWMPKKLDWKNLRLCLDNYQATHLFIRLVGSWGGTTKVNEDLGGKKLDFRKNRNGLYMLVDDKELFHFPLEDYSKGFSLAYERIQPTEDGIGRLVYLNGIDPYVPGFPEPCRSILRTDLDHHLMEISFKGRVHLKPQPWKEPLFRAFAYWAIAKPKTETKKKTRRKGK